VEENWMGKRYHDIKGMNFEWATDQQEESRKDGAVEI
jgi:hypothetical protein